MLRFGREIRPVVVAMAVLVAALALVVGPARPADASSPTLLPVPARILGETPQEGPYPPINCFPTDMEYSPPGLVYEYTHSVREPIHDTFREVHHYNYSFKYGEFESGSTWCFGRPELVAGTLSADGQTCLYAGVAAVVGAVIPQVGVVNAVFFFSTTCGIALLVD